MNTQIADIRYFYHADHLGSSSMLTDEWGDVYQTLSYMPFGEVLVDLRQDEDIFTPYQFNAKELDEETGLNYYVARYYNSLFSFFITSDPHRERYPYISSYAYCLNNPVKFIDPDGKKVFFAKGVSKDFKNHFTTAVKHLNKRGVGKMLNELEKSEKIYYITELIGEGSSYNTKINTISWNPTSGIFTNEGHELLPTTVLNHEIDHALEHDKNPEQIKLNAKRDGSAYGNKEEKRVITGSEQTTAMKLGEIKKGEVTRKDHGGVIYKTKGPTTTEWENPIIVKPNENE